MGRGVDLDGRRGRDRAIPLQPCQDRIGGALTMAIDHPLAPMSVDDKLQAMKLPWADLSRKPEQLVSPAWHGEVLRSRREVGTPPSACGGALG